MLSLRGAICFSFLSIVSTIAATSRCSSNDQFPINCSCFVVKSSTRSLTWDESEEHCSTDSATLASIKSSNENDVLGEHLSSGDSWIGLKAEPNSSFLLSDGRKAPFVIPKVSKTFKTRKCISARSTNIWSSRNCDEVHSFICVLKKSNTSCPTNWMQRSDSCFSLEAKKLNFTAAEKLCARKWRAKLAEFFTENDYKFVRKELSRGIDSWLDVWLGLRKDTNAKKYTYISDNSEPNYNSLGVKLIPTASTDSQRKYCVTMQLAKYKAKWEAKQCDSKLHSYVCQTEINRDFNITATNVNETSANISWSINPSQCGIPANSYLKLRDGSKVQLQKKITKDTPWVMVKNLKPDRKYEIEITSNNVEKYKKTFQTIKIRNPLSLLKDSSSSKINAMIGDTVNLLCAAKGETPIIYSWKKDNKKMRSYVETEKPYRSSILSVKLINHTSYGQYICHIQDRFSNMSHTITIQSIPDNSEGNQKTFVIFIVILAITVVVLLIIIAYFVRYVKQLKQKLTKTTEVDTVVLKDVRNEGGLCEKPQDSTPTTKTIDDTLVEDENAPYTALKRNGDDEEEEDHYYSPLKEAPLYVNASEFKNTA